MQPTDRELLLNIAPAPYHVHQIALVFVDWPGACTSTPGSLDAITEFKCYARQPTGRGMAADDACRTIVACLLAFCADNEAAAMSALAVTCLARSLARFASSFNALTR